MELSLQFSDEDLTAEKNVQRQGAVQFEAKTCEPMVCCNHCTILIFSIIVKKVRNFNSSGF